MPGNNLKLANSFAGEYDKSVVQNNWTGPNVVFNLVKNSIPPHSKILDLGIGTGESSLPFYKNGHSVSGVDGSIKMLEQCKRKNFAVKLDLVDLEKETLPFTGKTFDAVISNAVFHLIFPIEQIFSQVAGILKSDGYFVFTFENTSEKTGYFNISPGIWENKTKTGVYTYKYDELYISKLIQKYGFKKTESKTFLAFQNKELQKDYYFTAVLAQLEQNPANS